MKNKIFSFIKKYNMINKGDTVICGLSGGADSVCLLIALNDLSNTLDFTLKAIHINHCLRGDESDRDENFCHELCRKLQIPLKTVSCNVSEFSQENQLSVEEAARILRYKIFAENSIDSKIATAHNANDNLETVIFNLARGSALKGISGIPPIRDNIIRPLLTVSRSEIENYLNSINQDYVTDSTNLSDDYTRNKIRHQVLPVLSKINPSLTETSVNSLDALREENSFIEDLAHQAMNNCRKNNMFQGLETYHKVIRCRCISYILSENNLPYSHNRLSDMDNILINGGKINISGDIFFISDGHIAELKKITPDCQENVSSQLKLGENTIFPDKIFYCELVSCEDLKKINNVHKKLTFYLLDYDKIIGRVILRNRRFGDKIKLNGKNFTSSVKKLINEKIPCDCRPELHFLEDQNGTIFAEQLGIAERVAPDNKTTRFLKISITNK